MRKEAPGTKAPILATGDKTIARAAETLRAGGLVAFATETVYGLGARADQEDAVERIFQAKGRPAINPLIIHVADIAMAQNYVQFDERSLGIARHFWPGPLALILPMSKDAGLARPVSAGLPTVGVRCPAHKTARLLLEKTGIAVAAPSANPSGRLSATRAKDVAQYLGDKVDMILADKTVSIGLESTILDLSEPTPLILREGAIGVEDLTPFLDEVQIARKVIEAEQGGDHGKAHIKSLIKSPGQLLKHYAPKIPVRLDAVDVKKEEALLAFGSVKFMGIDGGGAAKDLPREHIRNLSEHGDLEEAAANLYAMLHDLEDSGQSQIAVMNIPDRGIGRAINERLSRAALASLDKRSRIDKGE